VHSDSRSCQILSALASETQHIQDCDNCFPPALHNNWSCCELYVHMNGQRLKHDPYPVYLVVPFGPDPFIQGTPVTCSEAKEQGQSDRETRWYFMGCQRKHPPHVTSAVALCYSVTEYCCPVWARSSYTNLIDTQLHSSICLISDCLQLTQLPWLPALSNVAPPSVRDKAAADNMLQIIEAHPNWTVYADVLEHPPPWLAS